MTVLLAGMCAAAALLVATWPHEPATRCRELSRSRRGALERIGQTVRGLLPAMIRPRVANVDDRALATGAILSLVGVLVDPLLAALGLGGLLVAVRARRLRRRQPGPTEREVVEALPDLIGLLELAISSGATVPVAIDSIADAAPEVLRPALADVCEQILLGARVEDAVVVLGLAWGEPARGVVHGLVDHLRYGTSILPALERAGAEARAARRRSAETRARRLPVLLLFPLVVCTLPAFGLLTVAPLVAGTLDSLSGTPLEAPASNAPHPEVVP